MYSFKLLTTEQSNKTNFGSIKSAFIFIEEEKSNWVDTNLFLHLSKIDLRIDLQ